MRIHILLSAYFVFNIYTEGKNFNEFPKQFMFGVSTAAYQVEGAVDEDGKSENIWDRFVHSDPDRIKDRRNADIACNSYHKYKEDVKLIKATGFHQYRFSISWSRILPNGHENYINYKGLRYYHNLIDELLANGIEPLVTIYHWDLPQTLQDLGGWANPVMADYFERYSYVLFREFGDKVKWWITINEPFQISVSGYGQSMFAPGLNQSGIADYLATHTLLRAHGKAYRMYKKEFAAKQRGKIGMSIHSMYFEPKTKSTADFKAAKAATEFMTGIYAHPIYSKKGDYSDLVKYVVGRKSLEGGWFESRLPKFSKEDKKMIRGSADFFGLNFYTSKIVSASSNGTSFFNPDALVDYTAKAKWPSSASVWLQSYPQGVRKFLNWIKKAYNNPPVLITEAGWSTKYPNPNLNDDSRIQYYCGYLENVLKAIHEDDCNVIGFAAWALMDNFEWTSGYTEQFGLHYVDFDDPNRPRKKRKSADFFKKVIGTNSLPEC